MLGFSQASAPSAHRIAEASGGEIVAVQGDGDVNWGRRHSTGLNSDTSNAVNKRAMREMFRDAGVPMPRLYPIELAESAIAAGLLLGNPLRLLGRPDFHTRGKGYWLCAEHAAVQRALRGTRRKMAATHFMEYIPLGIAPKEFRVHVFKGKSIRISQKSYTEDRKDYTTVKPDPDLPRKPLRHAATAAVGALGLDFGAVDILASDDQCSVWVLEVNCAPGLGGSMPRAWARTFINHMEGEEDDDE